MSGDPTSGRPRRRSLARPAALLLLLAVLVIAGLRTRHKAMGPPGPGPSGRRAPTGEQLGVNVNRLFNDGNYTRRQIAAQLEALRATGATLARSDALWEATEPTAPARGVHRFDWRFDDEIAGSLAAAGLEWLPIVDYSAPWARSIPAEDHSPPSLPGAYAGYAQALAERYGPGGAFWRAHSELSARPVRTFEIWNEPDTGTFWRPAPDAARYDELYLRAREAIDVVDRTARVIVGGLTHPASFLKAMLGARPTLLGHLDGVAIHPYGPDPSAVLAGASAARRALRSLLLGAVPLYVTEFGWTTRPRGALSFAPAELRGAYIMRTIGALGHTDCGISAVLLYTWVTPQRDPRNREDWFGIHSPRGGATGDVKAFTQGFREASRAGPLALGC